MEENNSSSSSSSSSALDENVKVNVNVNLNVSGLSKLLNRLQKLQNEYQKRRSVSEKRFNFRIGSVQERYSSELIHNKNELKSELAETAVALIHKHMSIGHSSSSGSTSPDSTSTENTLNPKINTSSIISARKGSLPAINLPVTVCPPSLKMARRQSVAAYPNPQNFNFIKSNTNNRDRDQNNNILVTPKSVADADLLAIKSRISKALKR